MPVFEDLKQDAPMECLDATPVGLDNLDKWLATRDIESSENDKARQYWAERIHLLREPEDTYTTRLLDYLAAYGNRLIDASSTAETGEKRECFERLIESIGVASRRTPSPFTIPLYGLLVDALPGVADRANPRQVVDEESLAAVAPENSLREILGVPQMCVIGDLHGDASTARFLANRLRGKLDEDASPVHAVFLGDYVNNGLRSIEVLEEVLRLKKQFPKSVTLLSGNHEFGETYATALTEFYSTHWNQWLELSSSLTPEWKTPPEHYGHLRLDLAVRYGAVAGEAVHRKFELWGRSLPLCAQYQRTFMCHSVGPSKPHPDRSFRDMLEGAKTDPSDIQKLVNDGYEAWKKAKESLHASMVNSRDITADTLVPFREGIKTELFLVGHTHYRSGDRDVENGTERLRRAERKEHACLATICSSHPRSKDAGHYIAMEYEWARREKFESEMEKDKEPSRDGTATSCVVVLNDSPSHLGPDDLLPLYRL